VNAVWKFPLVVGLSPTPVSMPAGARVLHVTEQSGLPCVWAEVDPDAPRETRQFFTVGTGWGVPKDARVYCGATHCGPFAWHVYEAVSEVVR